MTKQILIDYSEFLQLERDSREARRLKDINNELCRAEVAEFIRSSLEHLEKYLTQRPYASLDVVQHLQNVAAGIYGKPKPKAM